MLHRSEMAVPISQYSEEGQPCEPAVDLPGRRATASAREGENADFRVAGRVPICSTCELAANLTRRRAADEATAEPGTRNRSRVTVAWVGRKLLLDAIERVNQ